MFNGEQSFDFDASIEPQGATKKLVFWEIDNSEIASLESGKDNSVIVTALKGREATITARAGFESSITSTCKVKR